MSYVESSSIFPPPVRSEKKDLLFKCMCTKTVFSSEKLNENECCAINIWFTTVH